MPGVLLWFFFVQVEIVYQTQFFKGLANGGNVSAAFSLGILVIIILL